MSKINLDDLSLPDLYRIKVKSAKPVYNLSDRRAFGAASSKIEAAHLALDCAGMSPTERNVARMVAKQTLMKDGFCYFSS